MARALCPSRSTETGARCVLPDTWAAHGGPGGATHRSAPHDTPATVWTTSREDWARWPVTPNDEAAT